MSKTVLPLELVDKMIGSRVYVLMKNEKEFVAETLVGFDDMVNLVLSNVTEYEHGKEVCKIDSLLLNGCNISILIPGSLGPNAHPYK